MTPVGPSLPGNRSTRPYTIFELDQVRQQSRRCVRRPVQGRQAVRGAPFPAGTLLS